jgi:preprotein translocase subunit SecG
MFICLIVVHLMAVYLFVVVVLTSVGGGCGISLTGNIKLNKSWEIFNMV